VVSIQFTKGHGTQNDFVLIDDPGAALSISPEQVAQLCDRRAGLGGDGLIRVVRTAAILAEPDPQIPAHVRAELEAAEGAGLLPEWFMDYRNGDGSLAQMCGNGVRVFAAHLSDRGWVLPPGGPGGSVAEFTIGTRAGIKTVHRIGEAFGADLGPWRVTGGDVAIRAGADAAVSVLTRADLPEQGGLPTLSGLPEQAGMSGLPGLSVDLGNPHLVVALPAMDVLRSLDLTVPPAVDPMPAEGVNVEFIVPQHDPAAAAAGEGHLAMRVFERGVGETRSCGTGAVAAVVAARAWAGPDAPVHWIVDVPGGRLRIDLPAAASLDAGPSARLSGPAVLVAGGQLFPGQLAEPSPPTSVPPDSGAATASTR
jgi:diaminopimelate epimerase